MVSTLGMTNSWKCPPALTDADSRYYSCSDETSRSGFQRPACFLCAGQESRPVLRGVWGATAGASGTFRGRWWAEIEASEGASGSWTLLDDSNRIVLEGTWSARRVNASAKLTVPIGRVLGRLAQVRDGHSTARGRPILQVFAGRHSTTRSRPPWR